MEMKEILELTDSEKIKLYMKRYKEAENEEKRTVVRSGKKKTTSEYNILLSSGLDCVIEKKSPKETIELIIMPSQDKYFLKNESNIKDISKADIVELTYFFSDIPEEGIQIKNIVFDTIKKRDINNLKLMIKNEREYLKKGLLSLSLYEKSSIFQELKEADEKFYKLIVTNTPILTNQEKYDLNFVNLANTFYKVRGIDTARTFAESYTKSSMKSIEGHDPWYSYRRSDRFCNFVNLLLRKESNASTLIQYLCFDLYSQGFDKIPATTYNDYIQMCIDYDGKVKNKYPKALLTEHDIMSLKCALHKKEIDEKRFKNAYIDFKEKYGDEECIFKYKNLEMIIPNQAKDLIDEGTNLGHCVGGYVNRVVSGQCLICFVREERNIDKSYLTVELRPINIYGKDNFSIAQIQADAKRTTLTTDEKQFFNKLMDNLGFKTTNKNFEEKYQV